MTKRFLHGLAISVLAVGPAMADASIRPWVQMADLCETVLETQSDKALDAYRPAKADNTSAACKFGDLCSHDRAVVNEGGTLELTAVSVASKWIVCTARSITPLSPSEAMGVTKAWEAAQGDAIESGAYALVTLTHKTSINPTAVRCLKDGRTLVRLAMNFDRVADFRVGAALELPKRVKNPCEGGLS